MDIPTKMSKPYVLSAQVYCTTHKDDSKDNPTDIVLSLPSSPNIARSTVWVLLCSSMSCRRRYDAETASNTSHYSSHCVCQFACPAQHWYLCLRLTFDLLVPSDDFKLSTRYVRQWYWFVWLNYSNSWLVRSEDEYSPRVGYLIAYTLRVFAWVNSVWGWNLSVICGE